MNKKRVTKQLDEIKTVEQLDKEVQEQLHKVTVKELEVADNKKNEAPKHKKKEEYNVSEYISSDKAQRGYMVVKKTKNGYEQVGGYYRDKSVAYAALKLYNDKQNNE